MASEQVVVVTWNANPEEATDLSHYILQSGYLDPGGVAFNRSVNITKADAIASGHTKTYTPASGGDALNLVPNDGVHYFRMFADDTSNNISAPTATQSKRVIAVAGKIKVRR